MRCIMRQILTAALVALALVAASVRPVRAANKEQQQLMADVRILQQQAQQLQNLIGSMNAALTEALKAVNTRLDEQAASNRKVEFLVCDTAGRQHTKANLMAELQKIKRTLSKLDANAPQETLLVVDATTGTNALTQAREFNNALGLTGLIVTKLDGSGKGGIIVTIQDELGIPTRFIGTGETIDDFAPFDRKNYLEKLL